MKCPYCGSAIGIEDEKCPYCGRMNEFAEKHVEDMKKYEREFRKTKREVEMNTRHFTRLTVPIIILCVLIILDVGALIFMAQSDDIGRNLEKKRIERNYEVYMTDISDFIEREDYFGLQGYYNSNNLYLDESFRYYSPAIYVCESYAMIFRYIVPDDNTYYDGDDLKRSMKIAADNLETIYQIEEQYSYDHEKYFDEKKTEIIRGVQNKTKALFMAYADFTSDEFDAFTELSKTKQTEILAEKLSERVENKGGRG